MEVYGTRSFWAERHYVTDTEVVVTHFGTYVKLALKPSAVLEDD